MVVLTCEPCYALAPAGWVPQVSNTTNALRRVEVIPGSPGSVWSAGDAGTVRKTADYGTNWNTQNPGTAQAIQAFTCVNNNTAWVGAANGNIRKTTNGGTTWTSQYTMPFGAVYGLSAANANTAWLCGVWGMIYKTTNGGTNWTIQGSPVFDTLYDIQAVNTNIVWATGDNGDVLLTTNGGTTWNSRKPAGTTAWRGIAALDANTAWVVGAGGNISKTTNGGTNWATQTSGTTQDLKKIIALDANTAWCVGNAGVILKTTNGGTTWVSQRSGTTANLTDLAALDSNTAWAVGEGGLILYTDSGGWIPLPHIDALLPNSGVVGTEVTITGTHFFDPRGTSYVSFGSTPAMTYTLWSDTRIKCLVPAGVSGNVPVTVTTDGGTSNQVSFSVVPQLTALLPGSSTVGTEVTLSGAAFGAVQGASYVSFGTIRAATYTSWSDTEIKCRVPAGASGIVQVGVTTPGGTSTTLPFSVRPYLSPPAPDNGFINTQVTLTGTGFGAVQGGSYVTFGITQATTYVSWSDTEIKVSEPDPGPGDLSVTVTTPGGTSNAQVFTVKPYLLTALETWNRDGEPGGGNIAFGNIYTGTQTDNLSPAAKLSVIATVPYAATVAAITNFEDGAGHSLPWTSFFWTDHGGESWTNFSPLPSPCASGSPNWPNPAEFQYDYRIAPPANQAIGNYQVTIRYTTYEP